MDRTAVFVDAGYLFAQGSVALTGTKQPRSLLILDIAAVIAELHKVAAKRTNLPLLRTYWYDGAISYKGPTAEQLQIGNLDNAKLRLGFVNSAGEQKGVDSLIVTDLIELARLGAICDAVLLSGDEDVRVGVQIAQNYGVRVHLLGIEPSRGSQSKSLLQEADTTSEWDKATVAAFLTVRPLTVATPPETLTITSKLPTQPPAVCDPRLAKIATDMVEAFDGAMIQGVLAFWVTDRGVPPSLDGKLIATCRAHIGRDLNVGERRQVRAKFAELVHSKAPHAAER